MPHPKSPSQATNDENPNGQEVFVDERFCATIRSRSNQLDVGMQFSSHMKFTRSQLVNLIKTSSTKVRRRCSNL